MSKLLHTSIFENDFTTACLENHIEFSMVYHSPDCIGDVDGYVYTIDGAKHYRHSKSLRYVVCDLSKPAHLYFTDISYIVCDKLTTTELNDLINADITLDDFALNHTVHTNLNVEWL